MKVQYMGPCLIYNFFVSVRYSHCLQKVFRGNWAKSVISEKRSGYPFTVNVCFIIPDRAMTTSLEIQYWTHYRLWNRIIMLLVLGCKDNTISNTVANGLHLDTKMDRRATLQTWLQMCASVTAFIYFTCFSLRVGQNTLYLYSSNLCKEMFC